MLTLPELLDQLQFISQEAALLGLFVTASVILIGRDWRSLILALLVQYILVGLVLSRLVRPDIATLKVLIGAFICPILFLSARQVSAAGLAANLTVLMILVAINLSNALALPGLPPSVNTAVYWLILAGLITLALTEDPIKVGHGLFTALVGFELFYATVESSLLLTGLWGAINLLIALAIGYLAVVQGTGLEEEV
jgi:hypothetical protein